MKHKIVYLPLDERPCNYSFAYKIAEGSPVELIRPPLSAMGKKKTPANFDKLKSFLLENASDSQAAIISLDALLYGGIVPSRLHNLSESELVSRLSVLRQVKEINPKLKIYAFALIMRCPCYSSGDEEPDYYEYCGREIFLTGQVKHKLSLNLINKREAEKQLEEFSEKTGNYLDDFEARRSKNLSLLVKIVESVGSVIDFLVIPQDDSSPYGYTTMDREKLLSIINERGLEKIATYPGADEVGMTLLARAACEIQNAVPVIKTVFAAESAKDMIPLYEDRPLKDTLACQITVAGCKAGEEGDIVLFLNYPAYSPVHAGERAADGYAQRNLEEFTDEIALAVNGGKVAAVADGAYCNGGDEEFIKMLSGKVSLLKLGAYAGWNTSSNTLGTAICAAVFEKLFKSVPKKFIAERLYDDFAYQSYTRGYLCNEVFPNTKYNYFDAGETQGEVAELVKTHTQKYLDEILPEIAVRYRIKKCTMVWKRMFESEFEITEESVPFSEGVRGVWHRPDDTGGETDIDGLKRTLNTFKRAGINTVFIESFYHGAAAYRSKLAPYNKKLEKYTYGDYPDYLSAFVAEAGKLNISVHAWVEDFYVGIEENIFTDRYGDWLLVTKDGATRQTEGGGFIFLDPANGEVKEFLINLYLELLERFKDVKGLNLDYIRYPLTEGKDDAGYTKAAMTEFSEGKLADREKFIKYIEDNCAEQKWLDYRADKITSFVREVRERVKEKFPEVILSTAVFPDRALSYVSKKQDFSRWLKEGLLDAVTPMAYYDDTEHLDAALEEMTGFCGKTQCWAGLSCTYHNLPVSEVFAQLNSVKASGAAGFVLFGSRSVLENEKYVAALESAYEIK